MQDLSNKNNNNLRKNSYKNINQEKIDNSKININVNTNSSSTPNYTSQKEEKTQDNDIKKENFIKNTFEFLNNPKTKKIIGITAILLSILLFFAFINYLLTWKEDQSIIMSMNLDKVMVPQEYNISNHGGSLGAWISHLLIFESFGISSFLICYILILIGIRFLIQQKFSFFYKHIIVSTILVFYTSIFLAWINTFLDLPHFIEGVFGYYTNEWLSATIGSFGTFCLLVTSVVYYIIAIFDPDFKSFIKQKPSNNNTSTEDDSILENTQYENIVNENGKLKPEFAPTIKKEQDNSKSENILNNSIIESVNNSSDNNKHFDDIKNEAIIQNNNYSPIEDNNQNPSPFKEEAEVFSKQDNFNSYQEEAFSKQEDISYQEEEVFSKQEDTSYQEDEAFSKQEDVSYQEDEVFSKQEDTSYQEEVFSKQEDISYQEEEVFSKQEDIQDDFNSTQEEEVTQEEFYTQQDEGDEDPFSKYEKMYNIDLNNSSETDDSFMIKIDQSEYDKDVDNNIETTNNATINNNKVETGLYNNKTDMKDNSNTELKLRIEPSVNESIVNNYQTPQESLIEVKTYDPKSELPNYKYPDLSLLKNYGDNENVDIDVRELEANKREILDTLSNYKIEIADISAVCGPTVTLYKIVPDKGVRISSIQKLENDIAMSLAAHGIRIIAPIPGEGAVGIEVPNRKPSIVPMRSVIGSKKFQECNMELPIVLGKTIQNEVYIEDLAKMPHLLMAGATGQGKSVGINALIASLLYKKHPSDLKFVFIDPKKVELTLYRAIEKHFLAKLPNEAEAIITDNLKVINTLNSLCIEMDNRYELLKICGAKNLKEYNNKFINRLITTEEGHRYLPYIVVVIDEFADLIMTAGKEIETPVARIAQLARAVGIHLVIATQRPAVNVITGSIKANFPARLAFRVIQKNDSRTILDASGADQLIGKGDMLFTTGGLPTRIQCPFLDTPEVEAITNFISSQQGYSDAYILPKVKTDDDISNNDNVGVKKNELDPLFEDAARLIVLSQQGSTSTIQRKFSIGYNRAGRIMDQLEAAKIVGKQNGSKPRDVLFGDEYSMIQHLNSLK